MSPAITLTLYCLAIVIASLLGGWLPILVRLTHKRMELALSFVSGVMLGVAALLLLPHAFEARIDAQASAISAEGDAHDLAHHLLSPVMLWLLAGFLAMFVIERFFCFHHHAAPAEQNNDSRHAECDRGHDHGHQGSHAHALRWSGAGIGLTLHSLLDGVAIAASVAAANERGVAGLLAGLGPFLVVLLHKPFDALTLGTLLAADHRSPRFRHVINLVFALLTPIGAALFMLGLTAGESQAQVLSIALAFAAGTFLCIALSDVLPELQFHQHDRVKLSIALVLGLAVAWGVAELEQRLHVHEHEEPATGHGGHSH